MDHLDYLEKLVCNFPILLCFTCVKEYLIKIAERLKSKTYFMKHGKPLLAVGLIQHCPNFGPS